MNKCKECPFFRRINTFGACELNGYTFDKDDDCLYEDRKLFNLKPKAAEKVLHYTQKWRRGKNIKMLSAVLVGKAVDTAIRELRKLRHQRNEISYDKNYKRGVCS